MRWIVQVEFDPTKGSLLEHHKILGGMASDFHLCTIERKDCTEAWLDMYRAWCAHIIEFHDFPTVKFSLLTEIELSEFGLEMSDMCGTFFIIRRESVGK